MTRHDSTTRRGAPFPGIAADRFREMVRSGLVVPAIARALLTRVNVTLEEAVGAAAVQTNIAGANIATLGAGHRAMQRPEVARRVRRYARLARRALGNHQINQHDEVTR